MNSNLENNAPALIVNLLQEAIGLLQPTGDARECLSDALNTANEMLVWFKEMRDSNVIVFPTWTEFNTKYQAAFNNKEKS